MPYKPSPYAGYELYVRDASGNILATYSGSIPNYTSEAQIKDVRVAMEETYIYGSSRIGVDTNSRNTINRGAIQYELTNHLGNVLVVVTGKKLRDAAHNYLPDLVSTQDYSPFGMQLEGRSWNSKEYRFGFNGQQKDDEIYNEGNAYSAQFWEYDARLGRRWNIDPKPNPSISDYVCFANNSISKIDPNGDTTYVYTVEGAYVTTILDVLNSNEVVFLTEERAALINKYNTKVEGLSENNEYKQGARNDLATTSRSPDFVTARYTNITAKNLHAAYNKNLGKKWNEPGGILWIDPKSKELKVWKSPGGGQGNSFNPKAMFKGNNYLNVFLGKDEIKGLIFAIWHGHPGDDSYSTQPTDNPPEWNQDFFAGYGIETNSLFSKHLGDRSGVGVIVTKSQTTFFPWGLGNENNRGVNKYKSYENISPSNINP